MSPQEYIDFVKNKFGDQLSKDGKLIRDMNDFELLDRTLKRYPGDKDRINTVELEQYYSDYDPSKKIPPGPPKTDILEKMEKIVGSVFPGRKIGESLGNIAAAGIQAAKGNAEEAGYILDQQVPVPQLIGDYANAGLTAISAGAGLAKNAAARIGQSAALGAGLGGTRAVAEGDSIEEVAKDAAIGGAIGGAIPAVGEAIKGFGRLLGGAGDKIQMSVIKPTQADLKDGFSLDTIKKYDLGGSLTQSLSKTENVMDDLTRQLNDNIEAGVPVNLQKVFQEAANELTEKKVSNFGSNTSVQKALEQLRNEVDTIVDEGGEIALKDAQLVKRGAGHMGAWMFGQRDPDSTARERVYNVFYTKIKEAIEKASPEGTKEINKQISELIPVMNALIRRIPIAERNNALGLSDIVALSSAAIDPRALGVGLLNFASKSGWAGNMLSKAGEQVSKGVPQVIGNAARTLIPNATTPLD